MLNIIEPLLNKTMSLDPRTKDRLEKLEGSSVKIEVFPIQFVFFIEFNSSQIQLFKHLDKTPDVTIKGKLGAYTSLLLNKDKTNTLPKGIEIAGDAELAERIKTVFFNLEIDWEEILSHVTGDILAHQIGHFFRNAKKSTDSLLEAFRLSSTSYLQEEIKVVPTKVEVENFLSDVDHSRNETERLEASIHLLESLHFQNSEPMDKDKGSL